MIDPKELRIGNWVRVKSRVGKGDLAVSTVDWVSAYGERNIGLLGNGLKNESHRLGGIPLTNEILEKCGFVGEVWKKKSLGLEMTGPDGFHDLIVGMSQNNSYCAPMIKMGTGDGFTIQAAAEIQKDWAKDHLNEPPLKDESFTPMKMGDSVVLKPIKYLHQLQNLYFALTGNELEIQL